ncbi:MAG: sulfatase [Halopenitus sp.]
MTEKPNIVMVSWDSVRADHMPFLGYERNTCPNINEMAEESLVFENTQVSAVGTAASFTGAFTGDHATATMLNPSPSYWANSLEGNKLLPEVLQDAGYFTGGFHFNALMSSNFGWNRGWDVYEDHLWDEKGGNSPTNDNETDLRSKLYDTLQEHDLANFAMHAKKAVTGEKPVKWENMWEEIEAFVEDAPEPWFLWVLLIDTHHPYYAPKEYHEWEQPGIRRTYGLNYVMRRHRNLVGERRQSVVNAYDNTMRYADEFVRRLEEKLDTEGFGDEPFIFHSDHGDELGEHASYGHRPLMYDTVTRVPLVMKNVGETGIREGPHSLLDLGNGILEIAGIDERLGQGKSILSNNRETVTVQNLLGDQYGKTLAVVGPEWKVLFHPEGDWGHGRKFTGGSWEAYKHTEDPMEKNNRWGDHPDQLEVKLREQLRKDSAEIESEQEMEQETKNRLRELGYIE